MRTGELTWGGGKTCWRLGGGVADAEDLVVASDGAGVGATAGSGGGAISLIRTPKQVRGEAGQLNPPPLRRVNHRHHLPAAGGGTRIDLR
jgi:hypothetical protein